MPTTWLPVGCLTTVACSAQPAPVLRIVGVEAEGYQLTPVAWVVVCPCALPVAALAVVVLAWPVALADGVTS
jgi:hypothetical protein